jgi:hypothetical protein
VAAFLVLYVAAIGLRHASGAKNGDYIRVAAYLEEGVAPADPVLVYDPVVAAALEPYVERPLAWRPVPRKEDFTVYGFTVHALHGPEDVLGPLGPVPPGTTVWLVQDSGLLSDRPDLRPSFAVLEAVVAARFDVVAERSFRGTRVRRLRAR